MTIPPDFSRRILSGAGAEVGFLLDNTESFAASAVLVSTAEALKAYGMSRDYAPRVGLSIHSVDLFPQARYVQHFLPGTIVMAIFAMVMLGGGITLVDDTFRGVHEGYLVAPITRTALVLGFVSSGACQAA
jgi:ABC-2 type transport system permease protein